MVVGKDGKLALGAEPIEPADLVQLVKLKMGDDPARVVHLRGDKEAAYGRMVAVLDELATNGITHIAIVTEIGKTEFGQGRNQANRRERAAPAPAAPEPGK